MNPERSSPRYEDSCCMLLPSAMYLIIYYIFSFGVLRCAFSFQFASFFYVFREKEQRIGWQISMCFLFSWLSPTEQGRRPVASRSAHWVSAVGPLAELDAWSSSREPGLGWQMMTTHLIYKIVQWCNRWKMSERREVCRTIGVENMKQTGGFERWWNHLKW